MRTTLLRTYAYGMCEALKRKRAKKRCARKWHSGLSYGPNPEATVKKQVTSPAISHCSGFTPPAVTARPQ